jgi:hypothetical protein
MSLSRDFSRDPAYFGVPQPPRGESSQIHTCGLCQCRVTRFPMEPQQTINCPGEGHPAPRHNVRFSVPISRKARNQSLIVHGSEPYPEGNGPAPRNPAGARRQPLASPGGGGGGVDSDSDSDSEEAPVGADVLFFDRGRSRRRSASAWGECFSAEEVRCAPSGPDGQLGGNTQTRRAMRALLASCPGAGDGPARMGTKLDQRAPGCPRHDGLSTAPPENSMAPRVFAVRTGRATPVAT